MGIVKTTIQMDEKVFNEARRIAKEELNMTMSKFIEVMFRQLIASRTRTQKDMMEDLVQDLFEEMNKPKGRKRK